MKAVNGRLSELQLIAVHGASIEYADTAFVSPNRWVSSAIIRDLPTRRDWLDPEVERRARRLTTNATPPAPSEAEMREFAMPSADDELTEAQRLYEQTTQGEWRAGSDFVEAPEAEAGSCVICQTFDRQEEDFANAEANREWIAAAHNLWPRLVAREVALWDEAISLLHRVRDKGDGWPTRSEVVSAFEAARDKKDK